MAKKTNPKGRRNPQDTTLRNVRAAKKQDAEFSRHIGSRLDTIEDSIAQLEYRIDALQDQIDLLKV